MGLRSPIAQLLGGEFRRAGLLNIMYYQSGNNLLFSPTPRLTYTYLGQQARTLKPYSKAFIS